MLEAFILGAVQGIAEWLPVSSEGLIFIIKANFFAQNESVSEIISLSLFLHFGTFLAALVYFRAEVWRIIKTIFKWRQANVEDQKSLKFLIITSAITGTIGLVILEAIEGISLNISDMARGLTLFIALLLIITGVLQLRSEKRGYRKEKNIKNRDSILLGVIQALAVFPGLSRSGLTVSALLLDRFDKQVSLRLSFLMSLPIILLGNIILNTERFTLDAPALVALATAFVFGWATIKGLLKLAQRINFGYFVLIFAFLTLIAAFII